MFEEFVIVLCRWKINQKHVSVVDIERKYTENVMKERHWL